MHLTRREDPGHGLQQPRLAVHRPDAPTHSQRRERSIEPNQAGWSINGYPAILTVWSLKEWVALPIPRPEGTQTLGDGSRVHLRIA